MEEKFHPLKKKTCLEQSVHVRPRVIKVGPIMLAQALHEKCAWSLNRSTRIWIVDSQHSEIQYFWAINFVKIVWMCTAFSLTRFKGTELRKLMYSWDRVIALAPAAILIKLDSIPDLLCDFFMGEEATETIEFVQPKAWGKSCTKLLHECLVNEVPEARKELKWNAILLTKVRPSLYWGLSKHIMWVRTELMKMKAHEIRT